MALSPYPRRIIAKGQLSGQAAPARGVYGFRITGLSDGAAHLVTAPPGWPRLHIERRRGRAEYAQPAGTVGLTDERAEVWLPGGDRIDVCRDQMTVRITTREPVGADAVLHPLLAVPASIASRWCGRFALHGGAFVYRDRAWALLGGREGGKSTTLAHLLRAGHPILSDDVLIVDGTALFAGPRSVDLRAETAQLFGGEALGVVGSRLRWRLRPEETRHTMPLAGVVHLEWGDDTRLEPLDAQARLRGLIACSVVRHHPGDAVALLELAALPAWRFVRPRGLRALSSLTDQLVAALAP